MTVPELIANVLDNLRRHFYTTEAGHFRAHEFKRDEHQLIKAIATYGHECNQRAWNFECDFIHREMMELLLKIRTSGADIQYLPVYLQGAIRRHLGTRAEELSAKAKALPARIANAMATVRVGVNVQRPSDGEVFTEVFRGINRIQKHRRKTKNSGKESQSQKLLC